MGRRAKPIELMLINGKKHLTKKEIRTRRENEERLKPKADKVRPPKWLSREAKREFKRLAKELAALDLITNLDVDMLAVYCDAYVTYQQCTKEIESEGLMVEYTNKAAETNKVPHPLLTKKKQLFEVMRAVAAEFGLTLTARAKLALPKDDKPADPFGDMFD